MGRLAIRERQIYFEYAADFLACGLNVSPFRLPLHSGVQSFDSALFEGLPGLFNDSLPDGWGRLLSDRALRTQGTLPQCLSPLDRLVHVGRSDMGALTYEPDLADQGSTNDLDLDWLASRAHDVLEGESEGEAEDVLQKLLALEAVAAHQHLVKVVFQARVRAVSQ